MKELILGIMRYFLEPILIDRNELSMLSFTSVRDSKYGEFEKFSATGDRLFIKKNEKDTWNIGIGTYESKTTVKYVHQLQRFYFGMFEELLRRRGDEPAPNQRNTYYLLTGKEVSVPSGLSDLPGRYQGTTQDYKEHIAYQGQLYYVTWDCWLLIRNIDYAIWRISPEFPLFEYKGRKWGLTLVGGKQIKQEDTLAAGRWLQNHFAENNLVIQGLHVV
ncbi:hypothetical protein [Chitinophaga sp.]|uniref:hypothetical protein n=1 Tax=Chitinophaga sp. TaxID=1869181 RepID=UPI002F9450FB